MAIRLKAKSYGPLTVVSGPGDALTFRTEGGYSGVGARTPGPAGLSPSDLLLASLGSCILISARMAADEMGLDLGETSSSVRGSKALDLPHRLSQITVELRGTAISNWSSHQIEELRQRTKALCTVSNTLSAEVVLTISALTQPPLAVPS